MADDGNELPPRCNECGNDLSDDEQRRGAIWCDNCKDFSDGVEMTAHKGREQNGGGTKHMTDQEGDDDSLGYDYDERDCEHCEPDLDLLEGRWECFACGHKWDATTEEIDGYFRSMSEYHAEMDRLYNRPTIGDRIMSVVGDLRWRVGLLFKRRPETGDDIPF